MRWVLHTIGLITLVVAVFLATRTYYQRVEVIEEVTRDTVYITRDTSIYIAVPTVRYERILVGVPVYRDCDSLRHAFSEVWVDHHTEREYADTVALSPFGYAYASYTVFQNRSRNFHMGMNINCPEVTTTVIKHPYGVYGGLLVGDNMLTPTLTLTKGRWLFKGGYNVIGDKGVYLGVGYRIVSF